MPGLQTLVSAWVKVNQGHVEYFGENQLTSPVDGDGIDVGVGGVSAVPQTSPTHQISQSSSPESVAHATHAQLASGDSSNSSAGPRFSDHGSQQQSLPSSSTLPSYSFAKGSLPTPETNPMTSASVGSVGSAATLSHPSHDPLNQSNHSPMLPLHRQPPLTLHQHQQSQRPRPSDPYARNPRHSSLRSSPHHSQNLHNDTSTHRYNHHSHSYHSSVAFSSSLNFDSPPAQLGADAILGRRKSVDEALELEESGRGSTNSNMTDGSLRRSPSTSLWHSTRNNSTRSMFSSPPTAVPPISSAVAGLSSTGIGTMTSSSDASLTAELIADRTSRTVSVATKSFTLTDSSSTTRTNITNISASELDSFNNSGLLSSNHRNSSSSRTLKRKNLKQKPNLRRSHSRTDLVREMALNRNYDRNAAGGGSVGGGGGGGVASVLSGAVVGPMSSATSTVAGAGSGQNTNNEVGDNAEDDADSAKLRRNSELLATLLDKPTPDSDSGDANRRNLDMPIYSSGSRFARDWSTNLSSRPLSNANPRKSSGMGSSLSSKSVNERGLAVKENFATEHLQNIKSRSDTPTSNSKLTTTIAADALLSESKNDNCDRCVQLENNLLTLQADIEYLRTLELQKEFTCKDCESGGRLQSGSQQLFRKQNSAEPPPPQASQNPLYPNISSGQSVSSAVSLGSRGSRGSRLFRRSGSSGIGVRTETTQAAGRGSRTAMFLREASKRLAELSTRHKRQVKQSTHERAYWQNEMHLKLEKYSMMCKNLNEEAAKRNNEVKDSKALVEKITLERNLLTSQVDTLKARVALYEEGSVEHARLREKWEKEQFQSLDAFEKAVKIRDEVIADLASRLEFAVETIENERKQQRLRRQIIFPASRSSQTHQNVSNPRDAGSVTLSPRCRPGPTLDPPRDELDRILKTKEVAKKAQLSLQTGMLQSSARERALQTRIETLEKELKDARSLTHYSKSKEKPTNSGEGSSIDASLRHSSSTSSL